MRCSTPSRRRSCATTPGCSSRATTRTAGVAAASPGKPRRTLPIGETAQMGTQDRIVIVGGGLSAARVARAFRDAGGEGSVSILSADTDPPYNRPPLSKGFLRGELDEDAVFVEPAETYAELEIDLRLGCEVTAVRPGEQAIALADGNSLSYDRLVLASGSLPRALGTAGETLDGVHTYRTLRDARAVR